MNRPHTPPTLLDVDDVLDRVIETLADKFRGVLNSETIGRYVNESYTALYRTAHIRQHLPALTEAFAFDRLTALAQSTGVINKAVPEVLFLCEHNAGRSQLAAALLAHRAGRRVHVRSAGSRPVDEVHDLVVRVMAEVGVDVARAFPKPLTDEVLRAADVIVTMGCGDACPVLPGKRYLDWDLPDPTGRPLSEVRAIRDEIDARVRRLLAELLPAGPRTLPGAPADRSPTDPASPAGPGAPSHGTKDI